MYYYFTTPLCILRKLFVTEVIFDPLVHTLMTENLKREKLFHF